MSDLEPCAAGCGDSAEIWLDEAAYCGDCFGLMASEHLQEITGWRPCGHLIWGRDHTKAPAICLERYGTEHSHTDFCCEAL